MTSTRRLAGVLLALLAVSGCVSRTGPAPEPRSEAPRSETAQSETPSSEAPPTAADGADVRACADGNCEILLEPAMTIPVPGGTLSITAADDGRIEYEVSINGGTATGSAKGNCVTTFTLDGTGGGSTCYAGDGPAPQPRPAAGEMAMVVVGRGTDAPVLRLVTG